MVYVYVLGHTRWCSGQALVLCSGVVLGSIENEPGLAQAKHVLQHIELSPLLVIYIYCILFLGGQEVRAHPAVLRACPWLCTQGLLLVVLRRLCSFKDRNRDHVYIQGKHLHLCTLSLFISCIFKDKPKTSIKFGGIFFWRMAPNHASKTPRDY